MEQYQEQRKTVVDTLLKNGHFDAANINGMVDWFYNVLGLPVQYFANTLPSDIANHIQSLQVSMHWDRGAM